MVSVLPSLARPFFAVWKKTVPPCEKSCAPQESNLRVRKAPLVEKKPLRPLEHNSV
jgi:hypothetical protein